MKEVWDEGDRKRQRREAKKAKRRERNVSAGRTLDLCELSLPEFMNSGG